MSTALLSSLIIHPSSFAPASRPDASPPHDPAGISASRQISTEVSAAPIASRPADPSSERKMSAPRSGATAANVMSLAAGAGDPAQFDDEVDIRVFANVTDPADEMGGL